MAQHTVTVPEPLHEPQIDAEDLLQSDDAENYIGVRTADEVEALIARLNQNLDARMHGRQNITDSTRTLRKLRADRARVLRRR